VGVVGVMVTWQLTVPTGFTPWVKLQGLMVSVLSGLLASVTAIVPAGFDTGGASISFTVMVKLALPPMEAVAVRGMIVVEVVRVFTVSEAVLLAAPGPLSVDVITPVVLFFAPVVVPVTFTEMLHEPLDARVPAARLTEPEPATAVVVPPQVLLRPFGVATSNPAGSVSLNATPLRPIVFGLLMVKLRLVLPFTGIEAALKALLMVGGLATVMLADAVLPVPPLVEVTAPVVLFFTPEVVPVTFTEIEQELLIATVPVPRATLPLPAAAVTVPPQVLVSPFGVATTRPAGRVSVKATPVNATVFAAGFVMVKLRLVVPFTGIEDVPNALLMLGGATTDSVCCAKAEPAEAVRAGAPAVGSL